MRALFAVLAFVSCSRQRTEEPTPAKPAPASFAADIDMQKQTFAFGHAVFEGGVLEVHLTTVDAPCPAKFPSTGHTVWFSVPQGPDARFFAGSTIFSRVMFRQGLDTAHRHGGGVQLRIEAVENGRARGTLELTPAQGNVVSIAGKGAFDVPVCNPDAVATAASEAAPAHAVDKPVAGTVGGKPFRVERAFVYEGGSSIVLSDDASLTCESLKPSNCPSGSVAPRTGTLVELRAFPRTPSEFPQPASGAYWIGTRTDAGLSSVETLVNNLSVRLLQYDKTRAKGSLRGWDAKDKSFDIGGTFDAEVCPRTCQ